MRTVSRVLHAPPGRAGRLWLRHRLATAEQGARLLDHKLRILRTERERLAREHERTAVTWEATSREAKMWLLRATLLGGERSIRLSTDQALAEVRVDWVQPMGVRYPNEATWAVAEPAAAGPTGSAAVVAARESHSRALEAAVQHAVVEAAMRILEAEEHSTRRRLRAIEERWIPRLQEALADTQLSLEEEERADGVRLRWAAGHHVQRGQRRSG